MMDTRDTRGVTSIAGLKGNGRGMGEALVYRPLVFSLYEAEARLSQGDHFRLIF